MKQLPAQLPLLLEPRIIILLDLCSTNLCYLFEKSEIKRQPQSGLKSSEFWVSANSVPDRRWLGSRQLRPGLRRCNLHADEGTKKKCELLFLLRAHSNLANLLASVCSAASVCQRKKLPAQVAPPFLSRRWLAC